MEAPSQRLTPLCEGSQLNGNYVCEISIELDLSVSPKTPQSRSCQKPYLHALNIKITIKWDAKR
ncbi:Protein of unknown function [Gryllus bimaculatus]|nr:Protein of unknown function [Gryllus bimaculatus]